MSEQELLKSLCEKEIQYGFYNYKVDGISIYSVMRHLVRTTYLSRNGFFQTFSSHKYSKRKAIAGGLKSAWQILLIFLLRKRKDTVFIPWTRIDKINGFYLEKFSDSLIEQINLIDNFIIFDHGEGGVHPNPRLHKNRIVYSEFVQIVGEIVAFLFHSLYLSLYKQEFCTLRRSIQNALGEEFDWHALEKYFIVEHIGSKIYGLLFKILRAKRLVGVPRSSIVSSIIAARKLGLQVLELQHGITYGETTLYSGYRDDMFVPDFFLAFGDNKPLNVYGIDDSKIINIGWALGDYLSKRLLSKKRALNDILVISDAEVTDKILSAVMQLSKDNPNCDFYIRPHPNECFNNEQLSIINSRNNVFINDNTQNITVVLWDFTHVIGENSTVLYEALAVRKKVAKLYIAGLSPLFLEEEDKQSFWHIYSQDDFKNYLSDDVSVKKDKSIYSKFNKDKAQFFFNN